MSDSGKLYMKELYNRDDEMANRYHIGIDTFRSDDKHRDYAFAVANAQDFFSPHNRNPRMWISTTFGVAEDDKFRPLSLKSYMILSNALKIMGMKFNKKTGTLIYKSK
jgi:hypothetical protein